MTKIRTATIEDALAIATIHVRSWQFAYRDLLPAEQLAALSINDRLDPLQQRLANPGSMTWLVADRAGKVAGFAAWGPDEPVDASSRMLYSIYVAPATMGQGIGSNLLLAVQHGMISDGADRGTLRVLEANHPTRKFYERHGWDILPDSGKDERFFGIDVRTVAYRKLFIES